MIPGSEVALPCSVELVLLVEEPFGGLMIWRHHYHFHLSVCESHGTRPMPFLELLISCTTIFCSQHKQSASLLASPNRTPAIFFSKKYLQKSFVRWSFERTVVERAVSGQGDQNPSVVLSLMFLSQSINH